MKRIDAILRVAIAIVIIILELLPIGTALNYATPPDSGGVIGSLRVVYSYFSLTPVGYGYWGPFVTALLSGLLLAAAIMALHSPGWLWQLTSCCLAIIALLTSISPLMSVSGNYSTVSMIITVLLAFEILTILSEPAKMHFKRATRKNDDASTETAGDSTK